MNISYQKPLQEAISIPVQALAILGDLEAHIKKHQAVFRLSGLQPSISLESQPSQVCRLDSKVSRLYLQHVLKQSPFLSLSSQVELRRNYLHDDGPQLFQQPDLLTDIQKDISALKLKDCHRVLAWIADAGFDPERSGRQTLRIHGTPNISIGQNYPTFKNFHVFENLNLLQASLAYAQKDELPNKLIGHSISDAWSKEYDQGYQQAKSKPNSSHKLWHRSGLMAITSHNFMCSYFSIHTYRAARDSIHLTATASETLSVLMQRQEAGSYEAI